MTTKTKSTPEGIRALLAIGPERLGLELKRKSFVDWLDVVYIQEPPKIGDTAESPTIKMVQWTHLIEIATLLGISLLITILKARQIGVSWLLAAYALWTALYHEGAVVLLLSRGEKEAIIFLGKVKTIYKFLPMALQESVGQDSNTEFTFPGMKSKISALASTEHAGRSETASLVIQDEADFHPWLDANYSAIKPTIDAGGQLIMASTTNKLRMRSLFKQIFKGSPANGWARRFFGWGVRPGRTIEWYNYVKTNAPETAKMSPELYMEQEYPTTAEEALSPSRVLSAFDLSILKLMMEDVKAPFKNLPGAPDLASIFQTYAVGKRYAAFTDTSHGTQNDAAATTIMDMRTGAIVADIFSSLVGPDELALQSAKLLKLYEYPLWAIEDNDWGVLTIARAQDLGYPNLFKDPDRNDQVGWHTDERSRYVLWGELIEAVKSRQITVFNTDGLAQFFDVIRNPLKGGRIEAQEGSHDDYPFATGGVWQMRKHVYLSSGKSVSIPVAWSVADA